MLATTRIHKFVNHDGSCENISKNNFTLSIAVGSSDITAQASTNTGTGDYSTGLGVTLHAFSAATGDGVSIGISKIKLSVGAPRED